MVLKFFKINDGDIKCITSDLAEKRTPQQEEPNSSSHDEYRVTSDHKVLNDVNEISVKRGDVVYVLEESMDGFWKVMIAYKPEHRG